MTAVRVVPGFCLIVADLPVGGRRTTSTATVTLPGAPQTRGHRPCPSKPARLGGYRAPNRAVVPREPARIREALGRPVQRSRGSIWHAVHADRLACRTPAVFRSRTGEA